MKYHILYNPLSGSGSGEATAHKAVEALNGADAALKDIRGIDYSDFLATLAAEDALVICGGDGTLNHFVNDTKDLTITNPVFYFAAGTGNDFLNDIGKDQAGKLVPFEKYMKNLPTVTVNGKKSLFLNGIGYGIDGYCCEVGDKLRETSDKPINYTSIAIKGLLGGFKPADATVTVDGTTTTYKKVWLAPCMFGRFYGGGMMPTPAQDRFNPEHTVSVLVWSGSGKLPTLMNFPSIFKGEHLKKDKMCKVFTGRHVKVSFTKPCALQIDGETVLNVTEYEVEAAAD